MKQRIGKEKRKRSDQKKSQHLTAPVSLVRFFTSKHLSLVNSLCRYTVSNMTRISHSQIDPCSSTPNATKYSQGQRGYDLMASALIDNTFVSWLAVMVVNHW